jgi:hypothetical protein
MNSPRFQESRIGLLAGVLWASLGTVQAQPVETPDTVDRLRAAAQVPLDSLPATVREKVRQIVERPTVYSHGPLETFRCRPSLYYWFLDHPDRAVSAWRRLGAKCVSISDRGKGRFGWSDDQGSDLYWETVYRDLHMRIWHAEGQVRPAPLLPLVPVRAVVLLHHKEGQTRSGKPTMSHQVDLFLYTDSKTAALIARLMGPSAPRLAEKCAEQMEMFFSALVWYLEMYPELAEPLLQSKLPQG